ncbi:MAG: hypothetical protein KTR18_14250 [Acidiferrobacterales bacterium]|nr:hypothetical protein [Acidiferrobacterales bacterium]
MKNKEIIGGANRKVRKTSGFCHKHLAEQITRTALFLCALLFATSSHAQLAASVELVKSEGLGTTYPLWGKQTPKYVVAEDGSQYAVLQTTGSQPYDIDLYRNVGAGWNFWMRLGVAHQSASLMLGKSNQLHIIYPTYPSGAVIHWTVNTLTGARQSIATDVWGVGNYYQGAIYDEVIDRVYLCATQWATRNFRCGMYSNRWWGPFFVEQPPGNNRYLYPSIVSNDHKLYVQVGRLAINSANHDYNSVRVIELDLYGQRYLREYNMAIDNGEFSPFVGGLREISTGEIYGQIIYTSPTGLTNTTVVAINNGTMTLLSATPAYDDAPDLGVFNDRLYTAAWGEIHESRDNGKTWTTVVDISPPVGGNYVYAHFPRQNYSDRNMMLFSFITPNSQGVYSIEIPDN